MPEDINKDVITLLSYPRAIAHIDGDAFFTSCEQARDPSLKGRPVITGKERGIVSCASYQAKACGITRGLRLYEAKKICPQAIILPSDYELYSLYSERMFSIIREFTPSVEEFSIDEAFCDLTGLRRLYRTSYLDITGMIKDKIQKELDITVSAGLSLSRTLAKMCSKYKKPDGLLAVPGYKLHDFLKARPLETVCGFGPNTVALLNKCAVYDVFDYVKRPVSFAEGLLGKIGGELWHELRGECVYKLQEERKEKYLTISKTKTFMPLSDDKDYVKGQLIRNLESACIKLRRHALCARNIICYLKKADFTAKSAEARLTRHTSSTLEFIDICSEVLENVFEKGVLYRATGIILSDIVTEGTDIRTLFDDPVRIERMMNISKAVDHINGLYGKHKIHCGASDIIGKENRDHPRKDVSWRKKNILKGETSRKRINMPLLKLKV